MAISEDNVKLIFGLKLNKLRTEKKLSLSELSEASGLSVSYLNEIEKGKKYPKNDKILSLAEALGVSYDQLVSLRLTKGLSPIGQLINSPIVNEMPLDTFGIDKSKLVEVIANAPAQVSAFINTILEIARSYEFQQEHFYFASLRSYQEMYDNYFDDIEQAVAECTEKYNISIKPPVDSARIQQVLTDEFNYVIEESDFKKLNKLESFRAILIPGDEKHKLMVNKNLTDRQKAFVYGRELAFQYLEIENRPLTTSWLKAESFQQVLNNFRASYFSCALLINRDTLVKDLEKFFKYKKWDAEKATDLMERYNASPEMLMHRLTNILPKFFGISQLFFVRLGNDEEETGRKSLLKELHLSRTTNALDDNKNENRFREWLTRQHCQHITKKNRRKVKKSPVLDAFLAKSPFSNTEYFCITVVSPPSKVGSPVGMTLGLVATESVKKKIGFIADKNLMRIEADQSFKNSLSSPEAVKAKQTLEEMSAALDTLLETERIGSQN